MYRSVTADCPASTVVVCGGYDLIGAEGSVVLDDFIPNGPSLTVGAGEVVGPGEPSDGTTVTWQVKAIAVCAVPPPGYLVVPGSSDFTQSSSEFASTVCPAGLTACFRRSDIVADALCSCRRHRTDLRRLPHPIVGWGQRIHVPYGVGKGDFRGIAFWDYWH